MAENLVTLFPDRVGGDPSHGVTIDVQRCEASPRSAATLEGLSRKALSRGP